MQSWNIRNKLPDRIESGSAHSIMSLDKFVNLKLGKVQKLEVPTLCSYLGENIRILGRYLVPVSVKYKDKEQWLPLVVIEISNRPTYLTWTLLDGTARN